MKDKITDLLNKIKNKDSSHDEIGMAVHEEDEHHDYDEMHNGNHKEKLAVAHSTKDRIIEKVRGNLVYIVIAALIIIPGLFKLVGFFQEPEVKSTQIAQATPFGGATENQQIPTDSLETLLAQENQMPPASASGFPESAPLEAPIITTPVPEAAPPEEAVATTPVPEAAPLEEVIGTTPVPEAAPPEEPITTTPVPEAAPPENAAEENASRSMLASLFSFGGGSEETSGNMSKEANVSEENMPTAKLASIPGAGAATQAKSQTADQILQGYLTQENQIEDQLSEILARMDKLENNVAAVSTLEERIAMIETSNQESNDQQLEIVQNKLVQLEQGIVKLNQQAVKTAAANTVANVPQSTGVVAQQNAVAHSAIIVEAVVPGRAWVRNQEGVLMVVQVGDEISGVGKVTRIDAREGTVATATQMFRQ